MFVQMTVKPQEEAAFNHWYQQEYIPAFARDIPGIAHARASSRSTGQWRRPYLPDYLRVRGRGSAPPRPRGDEVPRRVARKAWKEWEQRAVATISDNLFRTTANVPRQATT